jgi:Flp pilus assembly protein TadG
MRRARSDLSGLARDARGVAAVEFAIILPFALALMALIAYGGQVYRAQRKVSLAAATVANLVARGGDSGTAPITAAEMTQILAYPQLILYPNDATTVQVVASEIAVTPVSATEATGTVVWSQANANAAARPLGQQVVVDPSIAAAFTGSPSAALNAVAGYAILGEVQLPFQPYDLYGSIGAMTLHDSILMIPRTASGVTVGP